MDKAVRQLFAADPADETCGKTERGVTYVKQRSEAPGFPKGWYREEMVRSGAGVVNPGQKLVYYYAPDGTKFRSKADLARFFGTRLDLSNLDFKTGKMLSNYPYTSGNAAAAGGAPGAGGAMRKPHVNSAARSGPLTRNGAGSSLATLQKLLEAPVRQCTCIYNQKVKVVESAGQNVCREARDLPKAITTHLPRNLKPKPLQVFWAKRLEDYEASDMDLDLKGTQQLPKGFKAATSIIRDSTAIASLAAAIYNASNQGYMGSDNCSVLGQSAPAEKMRSHPDVHVNPYQPLTVAMKVTPQLIEEQELQVQRLRQDLSALMAKQHKERAC
ncbi:methyl-CpG-binding domain protein 3-like [Paramacrobiotus metropolitanus]|uniref:methyl-CpG-binding domain protein 3-like n=1 Tax=Paramacrobiotus metropolitanus TaxID=2943436 RepID=UPI0024463203|nr:methyl-CpG-binding domain protein 3-like [Paramacrobiotus metropolitanus]XP_055345516.1 methyl-CpG-binding domain protein 3-like [Paramacrobiotus metropolitanus]XP_055345517.1 methyl-CpG-binding domain protein 3-like [Paramacrobiotus metropolitanus]